MVHLEIILALECPLPFFLLIKFYVLLGLFTTKSTNTGNMLFLKLFCYTFEQNMH